MTKLAEPSTPSGSSVTQQRRRQITSYKNTTTSPATDTARRIGRMMSGVEAAQLILRLPSIDRPSARPTKWRRGSRRRFGVYRISLLREVPASSFVNFRPIPRGQTGPEKSIKLVTRQTSAMCRLIQNFADIVLMEHRYHDHPHLPTKMVNKLSGSFRAGRAYPLILFACLR
jgi:hypothetical protein